VTVPPSEEYIEYLCRHSFLSFWSFSNPFGKKGKELCDLLVICGSDIIIISVKEINITESVEYLVGFNRWLSRAINKSINQIYGAENFINSESEILLKDGATTIKVPPITKRNIYRIAIAFGGKERFPLVAQNFGKGFIHVFNEESISVIASELDTISDFINYLQSKERFINSTKGVTASTELDLLGTYLIQGRCFQGFPSDKIIYIENDVWSKLCSDPSFKKEMELNEISYVWDSLIEFFTLHYNNKSLEVNIDREMMDQIISIMARENRYCRRVLSQAFCEFMNFPSNNLIQTRTVKTDLSSEIAYVFLKGENSKRKERQMELEVRCVIAKHHFKDCTTIIGIATEEYNTDNYSFDFCMLKVDDKHDVFEEMAIDILGKYDLKYSEKKMIEGGPYHEYYQERLERKK
jgi:hypothetical protein